MATLNIEHMIEEIRANVRSGDRLKARLVLDHLDQVDERGQNRLIYEISRAESSFAVPLCCHLLHEHPRVAESMPSIRELLVAKLLAYPELLPVFLASPEIKDKRIIIELVGEMKYGPATPALLHLITAARDEDQILQIIDTLGEIGDPEAINTLTDHLYAANRDLILAAVRALGQVATPTAMQRLAERMGTDTEIDLLILSIFARVQDLVSLERLNDALRSHYAQMRTYAKQELVRIGPKAVPLLIKNLTGDDSDFLIHTLNVLGDIGDESAILPIRKLLEGAPANANVRFAAYEALAQLPLRKGAYTLTAGLTDPEEHVCIAAARAIDRNLSPLLVTGLKNLLRSRNDEAFHMTRILINAQVDRLFLSLVAEPFFVEMARTYLPQIHRDLRLHYAALLKGAGYGELAATISDAEENGGRPKVVAVDDSRMILNIYKVTLHELGYEPVLFEFPESALQWLQTEKPLLVLTDLNMPVLTGTQLTEKIRDIYPAEQLPIIMVTTQNEAMDHEAARQAGVNDIISKPFNAASLKTAMERVLR